jgi:hypothetical protein
MKINRESCMTDRFTWSTGLASMGRKGAFMRLGSLHRAKYRNLYL